MRGVRLVEILRQGQYEPLGVSKQIITIFAGIKGFLDKSSIEEVRAFVKFVNSDEARWTDKSRYCDIVEEGIRLAGNKLTDLTRAGLSAILADYFSRTPLPASRASL